MAAVIIGIAFIIEVIFAVYSIVSRSNQFKVKSLIRIGVFVAFVVFTFVSVIEWSLRWYGLALLLLIWTIIGVITLLRGTKAEKEYKKGRIILNRILAFLLIVFLTIPAIIFPQYTLPIKTGEYKVTTAVYTYTDDSRMETYVNGGEKRQVTVEFWYPQNAVGTYPLVLFAHGLYGMAMSNASTYEELASNGYVVGSVSHPYVSLYTKSADGKTTIISNEYMKEASIINSGVNEDLIFNVFIELQQTRIADVNFILETVLAKAGGNDPVYQLIDKAKIGLFGHSMGGTTMPIVGRMREDIGAVINLDAPLIGELVSIQNEQAVLRNDQYPIPLLNIYTDSLWGLMDPDPIYAGNVRLLSNPPHYIFNTHISGAKHMSLTDLSLVSPVIANALQSGKAEINPTHCLETMNGIILNFFDCYLKKTGNFNPLETYN